MQIENEQQAKEAIDAVCAWLSKNTEPAKEWVCPDSETRSAELARDWSHELLRHSTANGMGGCELCQS